ncbi:MAG: GIY-YIG nuclease family protein [Rhizomicrobium sp.]
MLSKSDILNEIKRTALANGGKPLGTAKFENETGIKAHEWGRYWARIGDAQKEAGFEPNQRQGAYADEHLVEKLAGLMRKLGTFPTYREIEVERRSDSDLPTPKAFKRLGKKEQLVRLVSEYCAKHKGFDDVAAVCRAVTATGKDTTGDDWHTNVSYGEVYLFKSGRYYKIGRTKDTVRRGSEIRIQLPEQVTLIHSIKTDDPPGVEAYWHRRFEAKRMNGEWFDLSVADIKAFKRWRKIS